MMNLAFCNECLSHLYDCGGIAFILYEGICDHFARYGIPVPIELLEPGSMQILRYLETKRYVVTTEIEDGTIAVCPYARPIKDGIFFECKLCKHKKEGLDLCSR